MIISHKHKFIFIKPAKVAGTSIEINLAKHCGKDDIITPVSAPSRDSDDTIYTHTPQNYDGFANHTPPSVIREKLGAKVWDDYFKFTVVRNPWDMVVSRFYYNEYTDGIITSNITKGKKIRDHLFDRHAYAHVFRLLKKACMRTLKKTLGKSEFQIFVESFNPAQNNDKYYFDSSGNPWSDFYIYYENLDSDYKKACSKIGIPYEPLPKTKTKQRKNKAHYSKHYNNKTKEIVAEKFRKQIEFFNYSFEKK